MMKASKILGFALMFFIVASCNDDDSVSQADANRAYLQQQVQEIRDVMASGSWMVTTFVDSGIDKTGQLDGYTFTFDGAWVRAQKDAYTALGQWTVFAEGSDDDPGPGIDFDISLPEDSDSSLIDLNDDWDIFERTANRISLIDESGGNGGTDILVFEKI
ncbi:MAG: hypothetical protein ACO1N9_11460 [Flavobacterium sp.]